MSIYDTGNVFAKILRGELPAEKIYEDDDVLAIMDIMPQSKGHALVIPKASSRNLLDADSEIVSKVFIAAQRLARASKKAFNADGIFICQFNEEAAGQTVFHLHVHVIPRFSGVEMHHHASGAIADPQELADHAARIRAAL